MDSANNKDLTIEEKKELLRRKLQNTKHDQESTSRNKSMIFIFCSPRSGSTIFRVILEGHDKLFSPPELQLLKFDTLNEFHKNQSGMNINHGGLIRSFRELYHFSQEESLGFYNELLQKNTKIKEIYRIIQEKLGDRILVDKSPPYSENLETLKKSELYFNKPKYIFLIRHPYSVIDSLIKRRIYKYSMKTDEDPYAFAEKTWLTRNLNCCRFFSGIEQERYIVISYENLVVSTKDVIEQICSFLNISFNHKMLDPYSENRMLDGIGDPNIFDHNNINPELGNIWKSVNLPGRLTTETRSLATLFNYELPLEKNSVNPDVRNSIQLDSFIKDKIRSTDFKQFMI